MLNQDIDERFATLQRDGEQQIRVPPPQRGVDEATGHPRQSIQIEPSDQSERQHRAQLRRGVHWLTKNPAEHRVMRTRLTRHASNVQAATDIPAHSTSTAWCGRAAWSSVRDVACVQLGEWPAWMETEVCLAPPSLAAFLDLAPDDETGDGLDAKSRALVFVGAASCPAIADRDLTQTHMRRALELGATLEELLQTLRLAIAIGLHSISEGIMQLQEHGLAEK
jgi:hypothetical protein